jgi:hypothetical protein
MDEFKVGDKVWDFVYGWGTVTSIIHGDEYPVKIKFPAFLSVQTYGFDGKSTPSANRSLFFAEIPIPKEALERPRPDLKVDDPVWVMSYERQEWVKRHFAHWACDSICVFNNGKTSWSTETGNTTAFWRYKLPEDE